MNMLRLKTPCCLSFGIFCLGIIMKSVVTSRGSDFLLNQRHSAKLPLELSEAAKPATFDQG